VLRRLFGTRREDVTGNWIILHNGELRGDQMKEYVITVQVVLEETKNVE